MQEVHEDGETML